MAYTIREGLLIKDFGPIKNVNIEDLHHINVFVGESGSGKSTIMKVLAMMRWLYKMICVRSYLKISGITNSPFKLRLDAILGKNGLRPFLHKDSVIKYSFNGFEIQIKDGKILIPSKPVEEKDLTIQKIAYISDKRVIIPDLASGNITLRHNMFYLDETLLNFQKATEKISDSDMEYLGVRMNVRKSNGAKKIFVSSDTSDDKFENLPLTNASSGIQSSVALHFIIQYFAYNYDMVEALNSTIVKYLAETDNLSKFKATTDIGLFPIKRVNLHLEEPELSLFPANQWGLMKFLVECCRSSKAAEMNLTLATHSPYILTSLNIMTLAYRAARKNEEKSKTVAGRIPKLPPCTIGAWEVRRGECSDIIDQELQMIDGTYLDYASDVFEELISNLNDIIYG